MIIFTYAITATNYTSKTQEDIVILFTNDVHCGIEENIGYAGLSAYKDIMEEKTPYVTLVDCGDAIQGDTIGTVSKGEFLVDLMNEADYDLAVLGNHEFDYGMEQLGTLIEKAQAQYLSCNISYTGSGENGLASIKPYEIITYGTTDVAFTVLDVLGYLDEIPVCVGYEIDGEVTTDFPVTHLLEKAKPIFKVLPGWKCEIRGIKEYDKLPENCKKYVEFIEEQIGYPITMISNGPGRDDIIYRKQAE